MASWIRKLLGQPCTRSHARAAVTLQPALRLIQLEGRDVPALIGLEATDVPVSVTGGVDGGGDLAVRADDSGFVVAYESPDAADGGVYFKRYDANWQLVQGPVAVNTFTTNNQQAPSIGVDSAGNFVIAWQSFGQDPGDSTSQAGVYARRFLANGTAIDAAEFRVNTTTTSQQREPDVAVNAAGQFVIAFRSGVSTADIYAQSYAGITAGGSGTPTEVGGESAVNNIAASPNAQTAPAVAIDSAGNYVVVWQSPDQDNPGTGDFGIFLRRMTQNGTPVGSEFLVNTTTSGNQQFPDIAMDGSGNFNVVWYSDNIDGSGTAVVMRRFNAAGSALGGEIQVNTGITQGNQINPHIDATAGGRFLVTWSGEEADGDSIGSDGHYKVYNSSGGVVVGDTRVSSAPASDDAAEENVIGGINTAGDFVILFDRGAATFDTYLRRFAEDANVDFTAGTSNGSEDSAASIGLTRTGAQYVLANVVTTVQVARTSGSATPGTDFTTSFPASVTFPANGSTTQALTIAVTDDTTVEPNETIVLGIGTVTGGTASGQTTHTYTILDNDTPPTLSVNSPSATEGNSGTRTLTFTVTLSAASASAVTVDYATANGTATTADGDYTATSGTLTFAPGETSKTINVTINGDTKVEPNETLTLTLSNPTNATLASGTGTGTITNDDTGPTVSIGDASVTETDTGTVTATFTVTLSAASASAVTVDYATANGTATTADGDYTATSGTLTFAPGETSKTINVLVNGDTTFEPNEAFTLTLSSPANAIIGAGTGTGTITNDDPVPVVNISDASVIEGDSGTAALTFTVTLSAANSGPVTVNYITTNGTATTANGDYAAASGTLTFAPGETSKTITVLVNGDVANEADETLTVNLSSPTSATIGTGTGTGTITNDDAVPTVSIGNVTLAEGNSGTTNFTFTVTLSAPSGQTVTANYATADGSATAGTDYTATSGTLTFAPGETSKTVTVLVNGDATDEISETFTVNLSSPTSATIGTGTGTGTITDDDAAPTVSIGDATLTEGNSGTTSFTFTVTLTAPSGRTIFVSYATFDGTATVADGDYTAASGTLTFAPGETSKSITVLVNGDTVNEADETFTVSLVSGTNVAPGRLDGIGTIINDDAVPTVSIGNVTIAEGNSGTTNFTFTVSLSAPSGQTVTANYATTDGTATAGTDYVTTSGTLTFAPGETSKTITINVSGEATFENDESFAVNLSAPVNAAIIGGQATGTITNDDPLPTVTLSLTGGPLTESGGTATVTATLSNPSAFPVVVTLGFTGTASGADFTASGTSITIPAGSTSGFVTLTGADDAADENDKTVVVDVTSVSGGIEPGAQQVTVTVTDDDLPVATADTATTDEDTSLLSASSVLGNDNAASGATAELVGPGPAHGTLTLNSDGTYSYTPNADFNGTDSFQYRIRNTANEVSAPTTVTITVKAVNDAPVNTVPEVLAQATTKAAPLTFSIATGNGLSVLDVDAGSAALSVTLTATNGTLTVTPAAGALVSGNGTAAVTLSGPQSAINAALAGTTFTSTPGFVGGATITITSSDGELTDTDAFDITVAQTANELAPLPAAFATVVPGAVTTVTVRNPLTGVVSTFIPYAGFAGEVRVAAGDVNGDGITDVITGAGPGTSGGHVKVFDGATGAELISFLAFEGFVGGVFVAAGDVNADGRDDLIVSVDAGATPHVKVFSGKDNVLLQSFLAYGAGFTGGARVAAGDVNGDGFTDIITGTGIGTDHVKAFSGKDRSELASFLAYNGFAGGVYVGALDLDGDGKADLVTGSGFGSSGGHVKVFDGSNLTQTASYLAYPSVFQGGVRVGVADLNGATALLIGTGPALTPRATAVDPLTGQIRAELLNTPAGAQRSVFVA